MDNSRSHPRSSTASTLPQWWHVVLLAWLALALVLSGLYWTQRNIKNSSISTTAASEAAQETSATAASTLAAAYSNTATLTNAVHLPAVLAAGTPTPTLMATVTMTASPAGTITATVMSTPTAAATPTPTVPPTPTIPLYTYEILKVYPHDPQAFTQGLLFDGETLYEGTGLNGRSSLRRVQLETGAVLQQVNLNQNYFGEGIAVVGDEIFQLTWQNGIGFVYDKTTFAVKRDFSYPTEGWGITYDGEKLIMSDGSARLYFRDPATFAQTGFVDVADDHGPIVRLNELEFVNGEIYANIWQTDLVVRIDPASGAVIGRIDLSNLLTPTERSQGDVLNGIAYMPESNRLFVTGKLWPKLFEIRLVPAE